MKTIIQKYPIIYRYILALVLFGFALFISGLINKGIVKQYFPFASTIGLLIATSILYRTAKKSLSDIGLNLTFRNVGFLPLGILIGAVAFLIAKYFRGLYTGETFELSTTIHYKDILYGLYILAPTVAVEEFLFRGYLFKKTVEIRSVVIANLIFALLFTLVHVFDNAVIHSLPMVIFTVITIPIGHLLFATALLKSKSLFFPIGIHLGNNWATQHLISVHNNGESIFYILNKTDFETWSSFLLFILLWNAFISLSFLYYGNGIAII